MKKFICILLTVVLMIGSLSFSAFATTVESSSLLDLYYTTEIIDMYPEASQAIKEGLFSFAEDIDLEPYNITVDEFDAIYKSVLWNNPSIFYVDQSFAESTSVVGTKQVINARPQYVIEQSEYRYAEINFRDAVNRVLSYVDTSLPKYKQLRIVHDALVTFIEYETNVKEYGNILYTSYGALQNHKAVCQGYTMAYNYIVNQLGFETMVVASDTMQHTWSLVKLDDQWYHVDVTWDDPVGDLLGRANHSYFLVSDERMQQLRPRHTWNKIPDASCTKYDDAWWRDVETFIYTIGDTDYYIDHYHTNRLYGGFEAYNTSTDVQTCLMHIQKRWYVDETETGYWHGNFSQLLYDGELFYYNTADKIHSVKPDGTDDQVIWKKPADETKDIYGLSVDMTWSIYAELQPDPNTDGEIVLVKDNNQEQIPVIPMDPIESDDTDSTEESEDVTDTTDVATEPSSTDTSDTTNSKETDPTESATQATEASKITKTVSGVKIKSGLSSKVKIGVPTGGTLVYSTKDKSILKVTKAGKITALQKGKAVVYAENEDFIIKFTVKVTTNPKLVNAKNIETSTITVKKGKSATVYLKGKSSSINNVYTRTKYAKITSGKKSANITVKGLVKGISTVKVKVNGVKTLKLKVKVI